MQIENFFHTSILVVKQPLGDFYLAAIPANILLQICYSHRLQAVLQNDGNYTLEGSQRAILEPRLRDIGQFIDSIEAAFPNSIILAANFREATGEVEDDDRLRWTLTLNEVGDAGTLVIPHSDKLAAIIDGQHRLFGFQFASAARRQMPMVCAIYFDLPKPYQAFLFATINSNQKSVDRSQTYELFGYNVDDEPPLSWTPDKLAVFLARKLNADSDSPFYRHIVIAAENDIVQSMSAARRAGDWMVSTATIVGGILKLISKNPKRDAYRMHEKPASAGRCRSLLEAGPAEGQMPLREYYRDGNDTVIYRVVKNYFSAASAVLWQKTEPGFIRKTIGIQALFDILRELIPGALQGKDVSAEYFKKHLSKARNVDFADDFYQASGTGRTRIKNSLKLALALTTAAEKASWSDAATYCRLVGSP